MIDLLDKTMWNYIIKDIGKELEYLPYAILLGLIVFFITKIILFKSKKSSHYFYKFIFLIYLLALVHITFLPATLFRPMRNLVLSLMAGAFCSLMIETTQLITQRGYFQVDDILMNSIGTVIGCSCFCLLTGIYRICRYTITKCLGSVKI